MQLKEAGDDHKALRIIAAKLIEKAQEGDMQAIKELADRTDGKVPQAIVGDEDEPPINLVSKIVREIVRPQPNNSNG